MDMPEKSGTKKTTIKKRGDQPGHQGNTFKPNPTPDYIDTHHPDFCSCCGHSLESGEIVGVDAE